MRQDADSERVFVVEAFREGAWVWETTCDETWARYYAGSPMFKVSEMTWAEARAIMTPPSREEVRAA